MTILAYDIEVFKHQATVVFKDMDCNTVRIFTNNLAGLGDYIDRGIITEQGFRELEEFIKDKTLVGYNNYCYDDYILYAMSKNLGQDIIKTWNDSIIKNGSKLNMKKVSCKTLDAFQQIDVTKPGLKKIEGNMGKMIFESNVDFEIERPLASKENLETVKYCEYDVTQTINIFKMRNDYFGTKETIIDMLKEENLKEKAVKWNTTSIVGQLLRPKVKAPSRRLIEDNLLEYVPAEVQEMWKQLDHTIDFKFKKKKVIINEFGNNIEFGWGGLHGAPKGFCEKRNVKLLDVSSMYPSILILLNGLGDKTEEYNRIREHRIEIKHKDKELSDAYKLILNSTYGLLNNQYSQLNNPHLAFSICIYGQIALYELARRLVNVGAELVNLNTDGVGFCFGGDEYKLIWHEWEKDFGLNLELEEYDRWIQKDVNNYIALEKGTGDVKVKGGDVNKYHSNKYFANNDIRIAHIALVDYLVYGKRVEETIEDNLKNPLLFQYVLQAGRTYKGTFDREDNKYNNINRIFAANTGDFELFKKRQNDGLVKFADAPNKMFLWNDDVEKLENFEDIVDVQWYYDLVMKNLERWK